MIRPTKYTNPDKSIIYLSTIFLKFLKRKNIANYDELLNVSIKYNLKYLFMPTINMLFTLGLITYKKQDDIFIYEGVK